MTLESFGQSFLTKMSAKPCHKAIKKVYQKAINRNYAGQGFNLALKATLKGCPTSVFSPLVGEGSSQTLLLNIYKAKYVIL